MVVARSITLAIASSVLLGLGGCVMTRGSLTSSADRLEHSAHVFAQNAHDEPPGYSRGARELADRIDLKPVTESYLDVEREMGGYPERQARADDRHERY